MTRKSSFDTSRGLRWYGNAEEMCGRIRSPISLELFLKTSDRTGHDPGDEDRKNR